ncbi:hypothetical protein [Amycolatopsis sp. Hca4]|uniref:hypothetical protein n=1 Tax=Amycolatopsis sp. Hca4 TaxID=2742131 RepID=UPI0015928B58|nr:hypothetical protein [Amycolatopsis sp. Hca4]QKV79658.1 hypothetical protein HUT10_42100 [Amycolatopsis sp. Hca4]
MYKKFSRWLKKRKIGAAAFALVLSAIAAILSPNPANAAPTPAVATYAAPAKSAQTFATSVPKLAPIKTPTIASPVPLPKGAPSEAKPIRDTTNPVEPRGGGGNTGN